MGLFDFLRRNKIEAVPAVLVEAVVPVETKVTVSHGRHEANVMISSISRSFDGEKNIGELGPVLDYRLHHQAIAARSWQAYLESDIAQAITKKYVGWIIDKGLKLCSAPSDVVLKSEGITIDTEKFNEPVEARWKVWAASRRAGYGGMMNLNQIAKEAYKNAKVGGDVLVVLRYENDALSVQLVDGVFVCTPPGLFSIDGKIVDGIEYEPNGITHAAYHIKTKAGQYKRIAAKSPSSGFTTAFMVYGSRYRISSARGLGFMSVVLETIKQMDRYKGAALGSAEERAKVVYSIVHQLGSSGLSPLEGRIGKALDLGDDADLGYIQGKATAAAIAASTNRQTYNMTPGAELKSISSDNELHFGDFWKTNADVVCAAIGMPPNVAFSIYNDSFSASRAATKDWDHTMDVERDDFTAQFYQPIYNLWFYIEALKGKVQAPGYLAAVISGSYMIQESYQSAKFSGPFFPHINPLQEANAERIKLGPALAHIPLTTIEAATEALQGGSESDGNIKQASKEIELAKSVGIEPAPVLEPIPPSGGA